jgi:AcrR family transcriptional regulator
MQQRGATTRNQILACANQLFSKNGYDATGVAEICHAAGVSKGAFYHHFPSKQAVFMALLNSYLDGIDAGFKEMRREIKDVPQAILQMASMAGLIFQSAEIHLPIFLEFWSQARHDPQVWEATVAPYKRYQAYFSELIKEGIAQGSINPIDTDLAGRVLVSLAVGLLMESLFDPYVSDWQSEARLSLELLMKGIARRGE